MDLHFTSAVETPEERAAVDAVLGVPGDPLDGGRSARERRHLLLPVLHAIAERAGWISGGALNYACRRLAVPPAEAYGVATFYAMFSTTPRPPKVLHVCDDIACAQAGAEAIARSLDDVFAVEGRPSDDGGAMWLRTACLGLCDRAPAALLTVASDLPQARQFDGLDAQAAVAIACSDETPHEHGAAPRIGGSPLRLLSRVGIVDPESLAAYRAQGGYRALMRAFELGPQRVAGEVV
ncbi:MAG TPA: NAD(P)H-dependent oxidoreductase subunit E, partial [Candidatus Tumulicola sp.]|nr:NAD(P)H-dependent oxidoreductase subunit E [Candidatus Tumulicola sp.]